MSAWDRFWFRAAGPRNLIAARVIVALNALWLVLSRPNLPDVVRWPDAFWRHPDAFVRIRFFLAPLPYAAELALYIVLAVALLLVAAGRFVRASAFVSALLLYHFAPFEDIFTSSAGPFFRGFTLPVSALLILAFAEMPRRDDAPSAEFRWPLALMQLLFAFTYLMSGISKMRLVGLVWATARNFEGLVLGLMFPDVVPAAAHWFVGNPLLCTIGAVTGSAMDFLFITAVFSRRAARVVVPLTFIAHLVIVAAMGVVFLALPSLLIFVNWEWLIGQRTVARTGSVATQ
jgi:hypothetical protein